MRILPDLHYGKNFKKRYAENYDKIVQKRAELDEKNKQRVADIKQIDWKPKLLAFGLGAAILGVIIFIGVSFMNVYTEKQAKIEILQSQADSLHQQASKLSILIQDDFIDNIKSYVKDELDMQTIYLASDRYNNNSWCRNIDDLSSDVYYKAYIDAGSDFIDSFRTTYILYENNKPRLIILCDYALAENRQISSSSIRSYEL